MKQRIQAKKEKNIWSIQIMEKLLSLSKEYDSSAGSQPAEFGESDAFKAIHEPEKTPADVKQPTKTESHEKTDQGMQIKLFLSLKIYCLK